MDSLVSSFDAGVTFGAGSQYLTGFFAANIFSEGQTAFFSAQVSMNSVLIATSSIVPIEFRTPKTFTASNDIKIVMTTIAKNVETIDTTEYAHGTVNNVDITLPSGITSGTFYYALTDKNIFNNNML